VHKWQIEVQVHYIVDHNFQKEILRRYHVTTCEIRKHRRIELWNLTTKDKRI